VQATGTAEPAEDLSLRAARRAAAVPRPHVPAGRSLPPPEDWEERVNAQPSLEVARKPVQSLEPRAAAMAALNGQSTKRAG
jgi:hypothetical protein